MTAKTRRATTDNDRARHATQPMQRAAGQAVLRAVAPARLGVRRSVSVADPAATVTAVPARTFDFEKVAVEDARPGATATAADVRAAAAANPEPLVTARSVGWRNFHRFAAG
jgi:hypothetical protein